MTYTVTDFAGFAFTFTDPMEAWEHVQYLKSVCPEETVTIEVKQTSFFFALKNVIALLKVQKTRMLFAARPRPRRDVFATVQTLRKNFLKKFEKNS